MLRPVTRQTMNDQVYARLRHAIISGRIEPGTTFTLRQLAEQLGTSQMPVREAITRLSAESVLVVLPQRGIYLPVLSEEEADDLWSMRVQLEGEACARAARRVTAAELAEMRILCEAVREAAEAGDLHAVLERNSIFQFAVYRAARSPTLLQLIETLRLKSVPHYTAAVRVMLRERKEYFEDSWNFHDAVLDALQAGDAVRARREKQADLRALRKFTRNIASRQANGLKPL